MVTSQNSDGLYSNESQFKQFSSRLSDFQSNYINIASILATHKGITPSQPTPPQSKHVAVPFLAQVNYTAIKLKRNKLKSDSEPIMPQT